MSADNGIYILVTKDSHKKTSKYCWENTFGEGVVAYRVAEAGAIDNLEWYERNQPYNIGYWLHSTFGHSEPVYSLKEAEKKAQEIEKVVGYTEYGINTIERLQYNFPW
jgi:hypothetical protein